MSFKQDKEWSLKFEDVQDKIWKKHFGDNIKLERSVENRSQIDNIKDQRWHIDIIISKPYCGKISAQEKILRHEFSKYDTVTFERYQNRFTKENGEWFNSLAMLHLSGYSNPEETGYIKYAIIDLFKLKMAIRTQINWLSNIRDDKNSNADFMYIPYSEIPEECYYYKSWEN